MPRVSVILPVYNCATFLRESVGSILAQTFRDFELIAVDDGSSDESWEMLQGVTDRRLKVFRFQENAGVANARNYGVAQAGGEYVAFMDADDVAHPARLAGPVEALQSQPDVSVAASRAWIIRSGTRHEMPPESFGPGEVGAMLVFRNCLVTSSVLIRRQALQPFDPNLEAASDYHLWARLSPGMRYFFLKQALVGYRDHRNGLSKRKAAQTKQVVRGIHKFQLERLGVQPNLDVHARLTAWPSGASAEQLAEAELWLRELLAVNRIYDPPSFRRMVERIWYSICLDSLALGPEAIRVYGRSCLGRMTPLRRCRLTRRFGRQLLKGVIGT